MKTIFINFCLVLQSFRFVAWHRKLYKLAQVMFIFVTWRKNLIRLKYFEDQTPFAFALHKDVCQRCNVESLP